MIRKGHSKMSIARQCRTLSVHRSGLYYRPRGESEFNLRLMLEMDEHYLHHPIKEAKRMHIWLTRDRGYKESRDCVEQLYYKVMGLRAVLRGKHASRRFKDHRMYPYLLRNLTVEMTN
ncbi:hypothetical protein [Flagellimonas sp.]|uniref:hypothetical protein n=1 Tax=Flagellimonas sp. TaxID=2058762 RepID=UPI003BACB109